MLDAIIGDSTDAMMAIDADHRIVAWNSACKALLGYPQGASLGQLCHEVVDGLDVFGNPLCSAHCPLAQLRSRRMNPNPFVLMLPSRTRLAVFTLFIRGVGRPFPVTLHRFVTARSEPESGLESGPSAATPADRPLSDREQETLVLVAKGIETHTIAQLLGIRSTTVRNHVASILRKLGADSRSAAVLRARELGLIE